MYEEETLNLKIIKVARTLEIIIQRVSSTQADKLNCIYNKVLRIITSMIVVLF